MAKHIFLGTTMANGKCILLVFLLLVLAPWAHMGRLFWAAGASGPHGQAILGCSKIGNLFFIAWANPGGRPRLPGAMPRLGLELRAGENCRVKSALSVRLG